jgi:hypothetical protein
MSVPRTRTIVGHMRSLCDHGVMAGKIRDTLDEALRSVETLPADAATVALARQYADLIDGDGDLIKVGPLLLATLTALGMTPKARTAVVPPEGGSSGGSKLDELRARRARRDGAAAVDPAAT